MLELTLKPKYIKRANAIIKILAKKGWQLTRIENNKYVLTNITQEEKEDFIQWFTGETSWSSAFLFDGMMVNVKYFEAI